MTRSQSESEKESSQEQIAEDMLKTARDMVTSVWTPLTWYFVLSFMSNCITEQETSNSQTQSH